MSVKLDWFDNEKTIVHQIFKDKLTTNDLMIAANQTEVMYLEAGRRIFVLSDFTRLTGIGNSILPSVKSLEQKYYASEYSCVVVSPSYYIITLGQIARTMSPNFMKNVYFVQTLEEGLKKIVHLKVLDANS